MISEDDARRAEETIQKITDRLLRKSTSVSKARKLIF